MLDKNHSKNAWLNLIKWIFQTKTYYAQFKNHIENGLDMNTRLKTSPSFIIWQSCQIMM